MKKEKGISRRQFITGSTAIALGSLLSKKIFAQAKDSPTKNPGHD